MTPKEATLTLAAFLDSPSALSLTEPDPPGQRALAKAFLEACYLDAGIAPKHLDGDSMEAIMSEHFPARLRPGDPLAPLASVVVSALIDHVHAHEPMPFAFEARQALERSKPAFLVAVGDRSLPRRRAQPTIEHNADKVGRNDPCWCGSGTKFKKCHGR